MGRPSQSSRWHRGESGELFYGCTGRSGGIVIAVDNTVRFEGIRVKREDEKEH